MSEISREGKVPDPPVDRAAAAPRKDILNSELPRLHAEHFKDRAHVTGITIDPIGCRDRDDAIGIRRVGRDRIVDISIADVAAVVHPHTPLDRAAFEQSFTRYDLFPLKPMIPALLSEDELSLHQGAKRPTITVSVPFNQRGQMGRPTIALTCLESRASLDYGGVDHSITHKSGALNPDLRELRQIAALLLQLRSNRGALVAHDLERGILTDEDGNFKVVGHDRIHSHIIVQEFMILANEVMANYFIDKGVPALFRNHKARIGTTSETVQAFLAKAAALGGAALDDYLRGLGRFVERARYGVENEGHFALSLPAYMHFTSPIRRFPDLVNARQLHAILTGKPVPYTRAELEDIAEHTTAVQHAIKDKGRANFRKKEKDQQGIISDLSFSDPTVAVTTIAQIQNEIRASSVSLVNLARTLFIPPRQDGDWANVRRAALVFLENNPEHIPSVLSIATAKLGITFATQDLGQRGLPHQPIFEYCATITGQDHDAVGSTVGYVTKRESERRAALGAIYAWLGLPEEKMVTLSTQPLPRPPTRVDEGSNPIGRLQELCMKQDGVTHLRFEDRRVGGPDHMPMFVVSVNVHLGDDALQCESNPVSSKQSGKRQAATRMLLELAQRGVSLSPTDVQKVEKYDDATAEAVLADPSINWIGCLFDYCREKGLRQPRFSIELNGPVHARTFITTVTVVTQDGKEHISEPLKSPRRMRSKHAASKALLTRLRTQI